MAYFRIILLILMLTIYSGPVTAQNIPSEKMQLVGGRCEGCEAVFEFDEVPSAVDTLPDFNNPGPKLKVTGTVYQPDGETPAPNVVLYIYHTNQKGIYETRGDETGWGKRHGYIRGWVKTDSKGRYTFYTLKPGTYPSRSEPAHIHITVLEPNGKYYWLSSYLFDEDPLLTNERKQSAKDAPRGGSSGIMEVSRKGALLVGERDIRLGQNVSGYE